MTRQIERIGLISDTHGLLRPGVHEAFEGVSLILHAGDVGGDEIIEELRLIAPVHAVLGNTDVPGEIKLADSLQMEVCGFTIHVSHGHEVGSPKPQLLLAAYDAQIIVYGHTHRQLVTESQGRIVVNPGAAGHRRFALAASVGILNLGPGGASVRLVELAD
jgi:putative phosphoesterase